MLCICTTTCMACGPASPELSTSLWGTAGIKFIALTCIFTSQDGRGTLLSNTMEVTAEHRLQVQTDLHRVYRIWQYMRDGRFVDEVTSMLHFRLTSLNDQASVVTDWHMHVRRLPSGRFLGRASITAVPLSGAGTAHSARSYQERLSWVADLTLWVVAGVHLMRLTFLKPGPRPRAHGGSTDDRRWPSHDARCSVPQFHGSSMPRTSVFDNPQFDAGSTPSGSSLSGLVLPVQHASRPQLPARARAGQQGPVAGQAGERAGAAVAEGSSDVSFDAYKRWRSDAGFAAPARGLPYGSDEKRRPPTGLTQVWGSEVGIQASSRASALTQLTRVTTLGIVVMLFFVSQYTQRALLVASSFKDAAVAGDRGPQNTAGMYEDLDAPARMLMSAKAAGSAGVPQGPLCELVSDVSAGSPLNITGQIDVDTLPWRWPQDSQAWLMQKQLLVRSPFLPSCLLS